MKVGDYIHVAGKKRDWLDKQRGITYADYNALVIEMFPVGSPFCCCIMKSDGSLWKVYEKNIIGVAV